MKSCWHKLSQSLFEKKNADSHTKYQLFLSPYDVPNAFRHGDNNDLSYFIEFMYIPVDEKIKRSYHDSDAQVDFEVGENTGRVYKIIFHTPCVQKKPRNVCKKQIEDAFSSFVNTKPQLSHDKYDATKAATLHCLKSFAG